MFAWIKSRIVQLSKKETFGNKTTILDYNATQIASWILYFIHVNV